MGQGCLYIRLKGSPESLKLPENNLWIYLEGVDHEQAVEDYLNDHNPLFQVVHISFPVAKNPRGIRSVIQFAVRSILLPRCLIRFLPSEIELNRCTSEEDMRH